jgi:putative DNA-invertase from lambdoid prophage Rac
MIHYLTVQNARICGTSTARFRDSVKSGLAAASARGVLLGRQVGQRPSDKKAKKVLAQHKEGLSYRLIGRNLGLSKNTVMEIIKREAS